MQVKKCGKKRMVGWGGDVGKERNGIAGMKHAYCVGSVRGE